MNKYIVSPEIDASSYEPLHTVECSGICDGVVRTWREYIPSSYNENRPVPLLISLHGGNSGWGRHLHRGHYRNAFTQVAEHYGFIVAYAQSLTEEISWNVWELYSDEYGVEYKNDLGYLDWLIDVMCMKYNIDESRIYLYGHSFGDVMGSEYVLKRGRQLAAAALLCGPNSISAYFDKDGRCKFGTDAAMPVIRCHCSEDLGTPMGKWTHVTENAKAGGRCNPVKDYIASCGGVITNEARVLKMKLQILPNIYLWKWVNSCESLPELIVKGRYNIVSFSGKQDFVYLFISDQGHLPPYSMAQQLWERFYTAYRRVDGQIVKMRDVCIETIGGQGNLLFETKYILNCLKSGVPDINELLKIERGTLASYGTVSPYDR